MSFLRLKPVTLLVAVLATLLALGALQAPADAATARTLTLKAAASAPTGAKVTFSGKLTKSPKGSRVSVQRLIASKWTKVQVTTTKASGSYAVKIALPSRSGSYSYRAFTLAKGSLAKAVSKTVKVSALTPVTVTVAAKPGTITAGGTATFTGTVKPAVKNAVVTLQRQAGGKWASTGATAKVTSKGTYKLTYAVKDSTIFRAHVGTKASGSSLSTSVIANPKIASTSLPNGSVGKAYSTKVKQVGSFAGTWTVSPSLSSVGLKLNKSTGAITGRPTKTSETTYTFTFAQPGLKTATKKLKLTVTGPVAPVISTSSLPQATLRQSYSIKLTAAGNPAGTWSAVPLPAGLDINTSTGVISGAPTVAGETRVRIGFKQTSTKLSAASKVLTLVVVSPPAPVITTSTLPVVTCGKAYSAKVSVAGNVAGTWTATGLPNKIDLDPTSGVISGKPSACLFGAKYAVTIRFTQTSTGVAAVPVKISLQVKGTLG